MIFPFEIHRKIHIKSGNPHKTAEMLVNLLPKDLSAQGLARVEAEGGAIFFEGPSFFTTLGTKFGASISAGRIDVIPLPESIEVHYTLRHLDAMAWIALFSGLMAIPAYHGGHLAPWAAFSAAWIGLILSVSVFRFNTFLKERVDRYAV